MIMILIKKKNNYLILWLKIIETLTPFKILNGAKTIYTLEYLNKIDIDLNIKY